MTAAIDRDPKTISACLLDAPMFGSRRDPKGPFDFGDDRTVGKNLKRVGKNIHTYNPEEDFGIYLGMQTQGYVVGIKHPFSLDMGDITGVEVYQSLEEVKQVWQLD